MYCTCVDTCFDEKNEKSLMEWAKIGFPEPSTGQTKSAGSGDLENRDFGKTNLKDNTTIRCFVGDA